MEEEKQEPKRFKKDVLVGTVIGFAFGFILCALIVVAVLPSMMIEVDPSYSGFDATVEMLEKRIKQNGWAVQSVIDLNASLEKHGQFLKPRVKLINLCHPEYARDVLTTDRYISTMMPCTFGVYEGDDGRVYLSKINMDLMAKLFGGNIAKVMGEKVAADEKKILEGLVQD